MAKIARTVEEEKPTGDGFASFSVWEEDDSRGPVLIARVQHHHTKKALRLARLFVKHCPRGERFDMALMRETPLSRSFRPNRGLGGPRRETAPKGKDGRFRIFTCGSSPLEEDMWASIALATADAWQEAELKRKWRKG